MDFGLKKQKPKSKNIGCLFFIFQKRFKIFSCMYKTYMFYKYNKIIKYESYIRQEYVYLEGDMVNLL